MYLIKYGVQESQDPDQARRDFIARQRMGRLGTPEEIAHLVVYLAADEVQNFTARDATKCLSSNGFTKVGTFTRNLSVRFIL